MLQPPKSGYNFATEYTVSSIPWVTSSVINGVQKYSFPCVTKTLIVKNVFGSSNLRVAFTNNGLATNYFELIPGESFDGEFRVTQVFLSGSNTSTTVIAGLTTILSSDVPEYSSSVGPLFNGIG